MDHGLIYDTSSHLWSFPPVSLYFVHVLYIAFDPEASILYTSYLNCRACWEDRLLDTHAV